MRRIERSAPGVASTLELALEATFLTHRGNRRCTLLIVVLVALSLALQPAAHATKHRVAINFGNCSTSGPVFCEIQEAIDAAVEDDTIVVSDGAYGAITVDKDRLTIRARGESRPVIDAAGADQGVALMADGVTLNWLTVENAAGPGFLVTGAHNTLLNNQANDNDGPGFELAGEGGNFLSGNEATGNVVGGFGCASSSNLLLGNSAFENDFNGFVLGSGCTNTVLRGNLAENNVGRGFFLIFGPTDNVLALNTARDNGESGFVLAFFANGNVLAANHAVANGKGELLTQSVGFAVARDSDDNVLESNRAEDHHGIGFIVTDDSSTGNRFVGNVSVHNLGMHEDGEGIAGFSVGGGASANAFQDNIALANEGLGFGVDSLSEAAVNSFAGNVCVLNDPADASEAGLCTSTP